MLEMMTSSILKKITEPGTAFDPEVFQKLLADDGAPYDNFGDSVATSADGSTVVIGASRDDDKGDGSGSAYIFTKQSNGSYLETQKLVPVDGAARDRFGFSVAASDTSVVAGAFNHLSKGTAYVY